jgi:ComF family protein
MIVDAILSLLIAPACAACDAPLDRPTLGCVCSACWSSIRPLTEPLCETCGDALPTWRMSSVTANRCLRCRRLPRVISFGRAVAAYEGRLRDVLHALKYGGRRSVAQPVAHLMASAAPRVFEGADFVVPVPLHFLREYRRGFNQAEELARHLPVATLRGLRRCRWTATQTDLPEAQRHTNVRDAFVVRRGARRIVRGATLVLVDDVSTTGATLDACARVLLQAGAKEVRALTAARAVSRQR